MKVCIVGGGAVGSILAFHIYRGGITNIDVYYGSIESVEEVASKKGITVIYRGREYFVPVNPRHYTRPGFKCDIVLNAVKAYSVEDTVELVKAITDEESLIVSLQNGFGSYEYLVEKFGYYRVAIGIVFYGALRVSRSVVREAGVGEIIFGQKNSVNPLLTSLVEILKRGGCPSRITSSIEKYRWLKLAINSVINPITALTRKPNRVVYESSHALKLAREIIGELVVAAREWDRVDLEPDRLLRYVVRIARSTSENYSSMLQDVLAGRKTEIDYINGWIARVLEELGYSSMSVNKVLTMIMHLMEETS